MSKLSGLRLQEKLVISYVVVGACIALLSFFGDRFIDARLDRQGTLRAATLRETAEIAALAGGASEEGFSFVVAGNPAEKQLTLQKVGSLLARVETLRAAPELNAKERALLDVVTHSAERFRAKASSLFAIYEDTGAVSPSAYEAYDATIDDLDAAVRGFRAEVREQLVRDEAAAHSASNLLAVATGVASLLIAVLLGSLFGQRITRPLHSLRRAVLDFGEGRLDAVVSEKSADEIGELATSFERMAADTRAHLARRLEDVHRLEDIFGSIQELLVVSSADGTITATNPACCRVSGYSEDDLVGAPASFLFDLSSSTDSDASTYSSKRTATLKAKDGSVVPVSLTISTLRGHERDGQVLVARDLTEQLRLETDLRQSHKMEAIGRLAGGVAHDFNNMLSVIIGNTTVILDDLTEDDPRRAGLVDVKEAAERSADLTRQLLAFSRQESLETQLVNLNSVVETTARMMGRVVGENIVVANVLCATDCNVDAAAGHIEQVLMNLVVNARDAMPKGGKLTISTAHVGVKKGKAERKSILPGDYVVLSVSDSGIGMDEATRERIFEPFFTTKKRGEGTGLGLSVVFGIVQGCGGHVVALSAPGEGTTLRVYFPVAVRAVGAAAVEQAPAPVARSGESCTILLVEDEKQVRAVVERILLRDGYRVLVASGPSEALGICQQHEGTIGLLLTDVMMPQMSGRELADKILLARPDIRLLFMSGYTSDIVLSPVGATAAAFLQKPMTPTALIRKVREVLAAAA
jgi:PAS domain S-box-containing protein